MFVAVFLRPDSRIIMATELTQSDSNRRFAVSVPRPLWLGVAASVLLLAAVVLTILVPVYRQSVALETINRLGGIAKTADGTRLDEDWGTGFHQVVSVDLSEKAATDETLAELACLTGLKQLSLTGTRITDSGLAQLRRLKGLQELDLGGTAITDAGMPTLGRLTSLQRLYLDGTQVTDAGLAYLEGLSSLQWLGLDATRVTDAGLLRLKGLRSLWWLMLDDTEVTDSGVAELQRALPRLTIRR
jgi:hypothetical protein